MNPAVAATVRRAMVGVVEGGTARRASGSLNDGKLTHVLGGKTGTGDHEYREFDSSGREIGSRAVSRAGTFVYFIDDRFFGVVTAFVMGEDAGDYSFTSSLPVQLFKSLAPILKPALQAAAPLPVADNSALAPVAATAIDAASSTAVPAAAAAGTQG